MRTGQKKQAEQGIKLLERAHEHISEQLKKGERETALNLLEQCQQSAIELGQAIELEEGEGARTVSLLEDYCELVYQIYERIRHQSHGSVGPIDKELNRLSLQIEKSIKSDIRIRKEVVFLPYKASMWDSLESIWREADQDPDCDAYVIPIPYYDKNPDGSFKEMHYEGDRYPDYVTITDYENYDFAKQKPDMIFIHNPYDQCNYVTSVHPFFYSKNLKKFTEHLIYIPYFILKEPDLADPREADRIAHFCTCPGVIYADSVIVQSEAMRQIYIQTMTRITADYGYKRRDWEEKILGLGSPKTDKVLSLAEEKLEIPREWQDKIQDRQGNRKKIILYNTSIRGLLNHGEKMLEKMRAVFGLFKEYENAVALLWRPHPLLEAAIGSMRPEFRESYQEIVEQYKKEAWGIYDDTADLDRAIGLCDAYYGDASSVVQLCREIGKMTLIQSVEVSGRRGGLSEHYLTFENGYDDGKNIWFTEFDYNALFRMDKKDFKTELIGIFPDENMLGKRLYSAAVMCSGKLYFAPYRAREIAEYDPGEKTFKKLPVSLYGEDKNPGWEQEKFFRVTSVGKKLYFLPFLYRGILCYDTETGDFCCFDDWLDDIEALRENSWGYFVEFVLADGKIILPSACADAIVIFDTRSEKSQVIKTAKTDYLWKYCGICHVGDYFYLVSADGTVSKRKLCSEDETVERIRLPRTNSEEIEFYPVKYIDEAICLFPFRQNKGFKIDVTTNQVIREELFDDESTMEGPNYSFLTSMVWEDKLYAVTGNSSRFLEYDLRKGVRTERNLYLSQSDQVFLEEQKRSALIMQLRQETAAESEEKPLESMIDVLQKGHDLGRKEEGQNKSDRGSRIYHTLVNKWL